MTEQRRNGLRAECLEAIAYENEIGEMTGIVVDTRDLAELLDDSERLEGALEAQDRFMHKLECLAALGKLEEIPNGDETWGGLLLPRRRGGEGPTP